MKGRDPLIQESACNKLKYTVKAKITAYQYYIYIHEYYLPKNVMANVEE
jgi:hypothetical protein